MCDFKKDAFEDDDKIESSDEENPIIDENICTESDLENFFLANYYIASEESVSLKKNYILHLANSINFECVALALADKNIQLFKLTESSLSRISTLDNFGKHNSKICGINFMKNDSNIMLSASEDGSIMMFDLRTYETVHIFEDTSGVEKKTITCFDVNQNDRLICAGTDQIKSDVFLLFFDVRQRLLLGGYWESHDDDITQVKFHPNNPDLIASGSTDGLINIFDVSNSSEDDALQYTYNIENSIDKVNWHKNIYDKDLISCITHTNDLHIYNVEEQELIAEFSRQTITDNMKRKSSIDCNLINCHNTIDNEILLLASSNFNKGECIRTLKYDNKKLSPFGNFNGNKQIIRASLYDEKRDIFVTSGECGIISLWSKNQQSNTSNLKEKTSINKNIYKHKKPY